MHHTLLLIDGITGSGKSSTAQYLARQLNLNHMNTRWHHEEEEHHPLWYHEADIETMHSKKETIRFMETYPHIVEAFVNTIQEDQTIHIIESYYLQDSIRVLFQNNIALQEIRRFFTRINTILATVAPLIIYFHHPDVSTSIRQIWEQRGDTWKTWFIEVDSHTPYVQHRHLSGEVAALTLWNDYQDVTDELLTDVPFPVIRIQAGTDWATVYETLLHTLGIPHVRAYEPMSSYDIVGIYRQETEEADARTCQIYVNDHDVYWDGFWREQKLLPLNEQEYLVHSFPLRLVFQKHDGIVQSFTIQGTPIYGMVNTKYVRTGRSNAEQESR